MRTPTGKPPGRPRGSSYPCKSTVYMTEEEARLLELLAKKRDRSEAGVVRELIREAAEREGLTAT